MKRPQQIAHALTLRRLHNRREILLLPNAWDVGSAMLCKHHGFPAIATTSGGIAWALGYADGEQAPLDEVLDVVARIVRRVRLPLTVDLETGYGETPEQVGETVRALLATGAVGINLEDGAPGHGPLRPLDEAAARLRAARAAADKSGIPLMINARIDLWMQPTDDAAAPLDAAIERARAYLQAGADCIYPIGLRDLDVLHDFIAAIDAPVNVAAGAGLAPLEELQRIGVARVSMATRLACLALGAVDQALRSVRDSGRFDALAADFSYADAQRLFET